LVWPEGLIFHPGEMISAIAGINSGVGDLDGVDETVLRGLRPVILRYCRARLSQHAADDVAQEVCLALMSARRRMAAQEGQPGRPETAHTVTAYAFGIASHKVADAMRAAARLAVPVPDLPDVADEHPGPEETVIARWEGERVRRVLAQLPPQQRHLLLLRVVSGFSAAETGEVLGMSAEAVRVAQHRALARMRKLLASEPG
jgi:RNA polymerase sigma-70 factor (ECF subfamily)